MKSMLLPPRSQAGFGPASLLAALDPREASLLDRLKTAFRDTLGPPLKRIHEPFDAWLGDLPMGVAIACVMLLYLAALVWVWGLRRTFVFRGAPDQARWRDLRLWATAVLLPYIAVYLWLGR